MKVKVQGKGCLFPIHLLPDLFRQLYEKKASKSPLIEAFLQLLSIQIMLAKNNMSPFEFDIFERLIGGMDPEAEKCKKFYIKAGREILAEGIFLEAELPSFPHICARDVFIAKLRSLRFEVVEWEHPYGQLSRPRMVIQVTERCNEERVKNFREVEMRM